jgi:hypothetical protein
MRRKRLVSSDSTRNAPGSSRAFRDRLLDAANEAVLNPERYRHPRCFRLVTDLFARCGIPLPELIDGIDDEDTFVRNQERFANRFGKATPPWQPGDLVVIRRNGLACHFALILTDRLAIHAGRAIRVATVRTRRLLRGFDVEVMRCRTR